MYLAFFGWGELERDPSASLRWLSSSDILAVRWRVMEVEEKGMVLLARRTSSFWWGAGGCRGPQVPRTVCRGAATLVAAPLVGRLRGVAHTVILLVLGALPTSGDRRIIWFI